MHPVAPSYPKRRVERFGTLVRTVGFPIINYSVGRDRVSRGRTLSRSFRRIRLTYLFKDEKTLRRTDGF